MYTHTHAYMEHENDMKQAYVNFLFNFVVTKYIETGE